MAVFVQLNLMVLSRSVASVVAQHLRFFKWHASIITPVSKPLKAKPSQEAVVALGEFDHCHFPPR
jgi:hypothetical protein